jgi:hypothetical protein
VALVLAACFSPPSAECAFQCGAGKSCPGDLTCGTDGWCHSDMKVRCDAISQAKDAAAAAPDAAVETPDAAAAAPDAAVETADAAAAAPDAAVETPDAAAAAPDAPEDEPDAPVSEPDAAAAAPDARLPDAAPPDAPPPECNGGIVTIDDFADGAQDVRDIRLNLDSHAMLHASFVRTDHVVRPTVWYAVRQLDGPDWKSEQVADECQDFLLGQDVDASGNVHLTYEGWGTGLWYGRRPPLGGWSKTSVDATAADGSSSLAVGSNGVQVVYQPGSGLPFMYAHMAPSETSFSRGPLDNDGYEVGKQSSLVRGASGDLYMAYISGDGYLGYHLSFGAYTPAFGWETGRIGDDQSSIGLYPALALDADLDSHIAYGDQTLGTLHYLVRTASAGITDVIPEQRSGTGRYNAIAVAADGTVHITTYDATAQQIRYLVRGPSSDAFRAEVIEDVGKIFGRTAIALAPDGRVLVAYPNGVTGHARLATICPR